ncbi:MAG TPA: Uma2 family endonuclease [Elainellaceae cyanobacterium]|jgi:Uma2 family endonuclease
MTQTPLSLVLTVEEFLTRYGDNPQYELADGELIDMEPTGSHEAVAGKIASKLNIECDRQGYSWIIPRTCLLRPFSDVATARRPDVVLLDESALVNESLWEREPVIVLGSSVKLVVEVVSTNWETDYARKVEEYALFGIPEYWIVEHYRGLGGRAFIGNPKQPTLTVCRLVGEEYKQQQYRLGESMVSLMLPELSLKLDDVMPR